MRICILCLLLLLAGCFTSPPSLSSQPAPTNPPPTKPEPKKPAGIGVEQLATLEGHSGGLACVAFAPDGKTVATGGFQEIKLWDVPTGKPRATLTLGKEWAFSLVFRLDGKMLAAACGNAGVKFWDAATREELTTPEGRGGYVYAVALAPDGKTLASGDVSGAVKFWDPVMRKEQTSFKVGAGIHGLAYAPDGGTLATGDYGGKVRLWDVAGAKELVSFSVTGGAALTVAYAPDGKTLVSTSTHGPAQVWNAVSGQEKPVGLEEEGIMSVAFASDDGPVATGTGKGLLELRDATTWEAWAAQTAHDQAITALAFSPDGRLLATAGVDGVAKLWDVAKAQKQRPQK